MGLFRVLTDTFIQPNKYKEGEVIEYNGAPGPHLEPLNEDAHAAMKEYYDKNPSANLNPTEALSRTVGGERPAPAVATPILPQRPVAYVEPVFGSSWDQKAEPGVTEGGQLPEDQERFRNAVVYAPVPTPGGPGPRVVPDPPGIGSNAPTSDVPLELHPAPWPNNRTGDGRDPVKTMEAIGPDPFDAHPSRTPAQEAIFEARTSGTGSSGMEVAPDDAARGNPAEPGSKPEVATKAADANRSAADILAGLK